MEDQVVVLVEALLPKEQAERIRLLSSRINLIDGLSKANLKKAQVVYTGRAAFDPADAPCLRWVQLNTAAVNHIMSQPIARSGIPIANVRGAFSVAVAELTIGILLTLMRRLYMTHSLQRAGQWPQDPSALRGDNCHGKTIGIIGYGSIGRQVARIAQAMGMKVLACKRRPEIKEDRGFCLPNTGDPGGTIPEAWFGIEQIKQMLTISDVAVVSLPLTDATRGLIGKSELEALPAHACLINIGRGGTVDEAELIERLQSSRLAGAGLDVFESEPLGSESLFWRLPNTVVTPHIASSTSQQAYLAAEVLIENLSRDLTNQPLVNLVNLELGY